MLQTANEEAGKHGLLIPLDLGAKGSCNLGGYMNLCKYLAVLFLMIISTTCWLLEV